MFVFRGLRAPDEKRELGHDGFVSKPESHPNYSIWSKTRIIGRFGRLSSSA